MAPSPLNCDVLVIGGGAAGIAAAVAAGRFGATVTLLERYGFLGGLATTAQVGTVCGLYLRDSAGKQATPVSAGFPHEFAARLQAADQSSPLPLPNGLWVLPYSPPAFARVADQFIADSKNIRLILHATVSGVEASDRQISRVHFLAWNEILSVAPKTLIDCTGEAISAALAGGGIEEGADDQAPALVFVLEGVDPGLMQRGLIEVRLEVRRGIEAGDLPALCERLSFVPGTGANGRLALKLSLISEPKDQPLWRRVTDWERESRLAAEQLHRFLAANVAACRNARLDSMAPQLGVRSGRRIAALTKLKNEQVLSASKCSDGIARGAWPMERWGAGPKPEMTFFAERDYYEIAPACLRPLGLKNVLAAGRCLSAEAGAMTSARVIGTAMGTGWAAGTIAAFQAQGAAEADAVTAIQRQLHGQ